MSPLCSVSVCDKRVKSRGMCSSHLEKWRRYGNPEHVTNRDRRISEVISSGRKACTSCGCELPLSEFWKDESRPIGVKSWCKSCMRTARREWGAENRESLAEKSRAVKGSRSLQQKERDREVTAEWKRRNPEKVRDHNHRRRALKAGTAYGTIDLDALWDSCGGACPDCGIAISREAAWLDPRFASVDHIIPLSRGGIHAQGNLRYTCLPCNLRKGARAISDQASTVSSVAAP